MRARSSLALAALAAACTSAPVGQIAAYREPTALVPFLGLTPARPGTFFPYLAVANGRADELRILDPSSNQVLQSPARAFALSVPVLPGPRLLAAASLRDGGGDVLAVAGVGTLLQIVSTWEDGTDPANGNVGPRPVAAYDLFQLGLAGPGAEILCMAGAPFPGSPSGSPPVAPAVPGRALLLLGLSASSGGQGTLVVLDFQRQADGSVRATGGYAKPLGFDPVSLALSPDGFHLYAATPDDITDSPPPASGPRTVQGVAEIDMSGGPAVPWPVRGLDARVPGATAAPTSLVAAAMVGERLLGDPDQFSPPVPRVYAALDRSACGRDQLIECGIVTLDPATGALLPDPAPAGGKVPAQPYRTPLLAHDPNLVSLALAVVMPPASGPQQCFTDPTCPGVTSQPLMHLAPGSGSRWTTAAAAVGASDGRAYVLDLGRYSQPDDISLMNDATERTQVVAATAYLPPGLPSEATRLGLVVEHPPDGSAPYASYAPGDLRLAVMVTPGFTRSETWTLEWQGILPGLRRQPCVVGLLPTGELYVAMQQDIGGVWVPGPAPADPRLGIHAADPAIGQEGDSVLFELVGDPSICEVTDTSGNAVPHEAPIAQILPPSPQDYPARALGLSMPVGGDPYKLQCLADHLATNPTPLACQTTVRAAALVLSGSRTGYAGRPLLNRRYDLAWADESALSGEKLYLARRARRFYYPSEPPCSSIGCYAGFPELTDPLAPGPVLGLRPTRLCPSSSGPPTPCAGVLARDTGISFTTSSGLVSMSAATSPTSLPSGATSFDKSQFPGLEPHGSVFYLSYLGDAVLEFAPSNPGYNATLR